MTSTRGPGGTSHSRSRASPRRAAPQAPRGDQAQGLRHLPLDRRRAKAVPRRPGPAAEQQDDGVCPGLGAINK
jgi:hypothetical protein